MFSSNEWNEAAASADWEEEEEEEEASAASAAAAAAIREAEASYSDNVAIAGMKLAQIPTCLLQLSFLQFLYASRNHLQALPLDFFERLSNLRWLDLRHNWLTALPFAGLHQHQRLQYLLLEENCIASLPTELGCVRTLRGLALSGNPLQFPDADVVARGVQFVKHFLREAHEFRRRNDSGSGATPTGDEQLLPAIGAGNCGSTGSRLAARQSRDRQPEAPAANRGRPVDWLAVNPCPSPQGADQSEASEAEDSRYSREAALRRRRRLEAASQWRREAKRLQAVRIRDQLMERATRGQSDQHQQQQQQQQQQSSGFSRRRSGQQQLTPAEEIEEAKRSVQQAQEMQRHLARRGAQLQRRALASEPDLLDTRGHRRRGREAVNCHL